MFHDKITDLDLRGRQLDNVNFWGLRLKATDNTRIKLQPIFRRRKTKSVNEDHFPDSLRQLC